MRFLLVHDYGTLNGGAEVMVTNLRAALRARGHDARLFTSSARPLPLPIVADETCFGTVRPARRVVQAFNPHAAWRLREILASYRPDIVLVKMFLTQLSPLILQPLRDVPAILSVINYNLICPINTKTLPDGRPCHERAGSVCHARGCMSWPGVARAAVQRRLLDLGVFDRIVANSAWVAKRLEAEGVRVDGWIHNGVSETAARPPLSGPPTIGYAGRLIPKKGVDVLLRAFAVVRDRLPDARLRIVGDGSERMRLEALARSLGIEARTEFRGHLDAGEMEEALGEAWVQCVPSAWEEPFGLVVAEAMMRGTAVVAGDLGGIPEQVEEGRTGFLVRAHEPDAFAGALIRVLSDRDHAERLGAEGRVRALRRFTFDRHVDRVLELAESVIDSRQAADC